MHTAPPGGVYGPLPGGAFLLRAQSPYLLNGTGSAFALSPLLYARATR